MLPSSLWYISEAHRGTNRLLKMCSPYIHRVKYTVNGRESRKKTQTVYSFHAAFSGRSAQIGECITLGLKCKISTLCVINKKVWGFTYQTTTKVMGSRTRNAIQYAVESFRLHRRQSGDNRMSHKCLEETHSTTPDMNVKSVDDDVGAK